MDVYEAVRSRQSIRAFTPEPVCREVLERVLGAASRCLSGSNLQPWHLYVVTGEALAQVKKRIGQRVAAGDVRDEREFPLYPPELISPYQQRLDQFAAYRYGALGIARDDAAGRARARAENWNCYGASTLLLCYLDRDMSFPQWADAGMFLQTVMLLLRAEGLGSCPQLAWSEFHRTVAEAINPPPVWVLFCGMSIGYPDPTAAHPRIPRAALSETVTFLE